MFCLNLKTIKSVLPLFLSLLVFPSLLMSSTYSFQDDALTVLDLAKRSETLRSRMVEFCQRNKDAERITGEEHNQVDRAIREYGAIRIRLWDIIERVRTKTKMGQGHRPVMGFIKKIGGALRTNTRLSKAEEDEKIQALLIGVSAAATLVDNAACAIEQVAGTIWEKRANRPVNMTPDEDLNNFKLDLVVDDLFKEVMVSYNSASNRDAYKEVVEYLVSKQERIKYLCEYGKSSDEIRQLNELVFSDGKGKVSFNVDLSEDYKARIESAKAGLGERLEADMNALSKVFGNAMGSIHLGTATIKGDIRKDVEERLLEVLEPGDLLLDKTSFAMTDRLIPGHFGHVAIWLGKPDQLEELGLFNPEVNTYGDSLKNALAWKDKLAEGKCVLEALRPGVVINTLEHFLHVDEVLVLRLKPEFVGGEDELQKLRSQIVCRGMHHLGQRYDFNFDVNTSNTIVCSELAYQAYPDTICWPLTKTAGRWTISPDQVAVMAGPGKSFPLDIVYYVRSVWDGNEIVGQEHLKGLPVGGEDHYEFYWSTLLKEYPLPNEADFDNDCLKGWAKAVGELAQKYNIKTVSE